MKEKQPKHRKEDWLPEVGERVYAFVNYDRRTKEFDIISGTVTSVREGFDFKKEYGGEIERSLEPVVRIDDEIEVHPSRVASAELMDYILRKMTWIEFWDLCATVGKWDEAVHQIMEENE